MIPLKIIAILANASLRAERKAALVKLHTEDFKEFIDEFYQLPVNQIELTHVRSYMVSLLEKELAKTSVSRKISSVKSFFKYLLKENIIDSSPVHLIETQKLE